MKIDVFISYHSETSQALAGKIANRLESMGYNCWFSGKNLGGGDYASGIMDALNECRVFLLILNKAASESAHVLNELEIATNRLNHKEELTIIPFRVTDEEIGPAAQYYISRHHWVDATNPPMDRHITELVNQVAALLHTPEDLAEMERAKKAERRQIFLKTLFCAAMAAALGFGYWTLMKTGETQHLYYLMHILLVSAPMLQLLFEKHRQADRRAADLAQYLLIAAAVIFFVDVFDLRSLKSLGEVERIYDMVVSLERSDFTENVIFYGGAYILLLFYPWHRELMKTGKWKFLWTLVCLLTAVWTMAVCILQAKTVGQGNVIAAGICLWGVIAGGYIIFHGILEHRKMRNK